VALGNTLQITLARSVLRAMFLLQRESHRLVIAATIRDGLAHLRSHASPQSPSVSAARDLLDAMCAALGVAPEALGVAPEE
jgi:hypothetical protein